MSTWFATWFDSSYYHLLYQHRDDTEAQFFMDQLVNYLAPAPTHRLLDLACGKGRHSIYLAQKGYEVVGVDLSPESIAHAQKFGHDRLSFATHDMRQPLELPAFDYVFNLFTSFGYFPNEEEHLQTLQAMRQNLKGDDSRLVIDFFNAPQVISKLVLQEEKTLSGVTFRLQRRVENGYIIKDIRFEDKGQDFHFQERVRAFDLADFERLLPQANLRLLETFGGYDLSPYDASTSSRLILLAERC
ncbi:MAG: class I SAM-dependent methyltransferase [Aureispira sp.]